MGLQLMLFSQIWVEKEKSASVVVLEPKEGGEGAMPAVLLNDISLRMFMAKRPSETTSEVSGQLSMSQTLVRKLTLNQR